MLSPGKFGFKRSVIYKDLLKSAIEFHNFIQDLSESRENNFEDVDSVEHIKLMELGGGLE